MSLKERIEAALALDFYASVRDVLRDCAAEIERLTTQAENDADHARSLMAENERLASSCNNESHYDPTDQIRKAHAERDALKARVAELEAQVQFNEDRHAVLLESLDNDLGWSCNLEEMPKLYKTRLDAMKARVAELEAREDLEFNAMAAQAENDADHARSLMSENERLMESMRKARQHLWRIYSHYSEAEVAEAAESNSGSYGLALRILDAAIAKAEER